MEEGREGGRKGKGEEGRKGGERGKKKEGRQEERKKKEGRKEKRNQMVSLYVELQVREE